MLYRLLKEFEALTGVPVLINTSFNIKGEPIVETPQDAVNCFLTTGIDHLVMHDTMVSKAAMHKVVAPLVNIYTDVRDAGGVDRAAGLSGCPAELRSDRAAALRPAFGAAAVPWAAACPAASTRRCSRRRWS